MLDVISTKTPYTVDLAELVMVQDATSAIDDFNRYIYTASGKTEIQLAESPSLVSSFHIRQAPLVRLSETAKKAPSKRLQEFVTASDISYHDVAANRYEGLSIAIEQGDVYYIEAGTLLEVGELKRNTSGIYRQASVKASEIYWKEARKGVPYHINMIEELARTADFNKRIAERLNPSEAPANHTGITYTEPMTVAETEHAEIGVNAAEGVTYGISIDTIYIINANFIEGISLAVDVPKEMETYYAGGITAKDVRVLGNPGAILSDIYVGKNGITLAEFEDMAAKPAEYTPFTEFKVGEYEYQDAMYRMVIRKDNTAANPLVYGYAVHVDIDDVKDRGTATLKAEETKVYFNRTYYTTPDVVVNVVGGLEGETVTPVITGEGTDDAGRYFTVVLKNSSGTAVAGTITWNSNGY